MYPGAGLGMHQGLLVIGYSLHAKGDIQKVV
jgi:hypothetical protein